MLDQIRKQSQSALIVLLFGFIIFVFVFSFGAGSKGFNKGGCGRSGAAALVNGESVPEWVFEYYYTQILQNAVRQREGGKALRLEDRLRIRQEVMDRIFNLALLRQAAQRIGLRVSEQERNDYIRQMPDFQDTNKRFDYRRYKTMIQNGYRTTTNIFEQVKTEELLSQRMLDIILATARVTDDELLNAYLERETKADLDFVKVPATSYIKGISLTEAQIEDTIRSKVDQIKSYYESHQELYHKPKQVQAAHVFFQVNKELDAEQIKAKREQAELSLDEVKKGSDFASQAKEYSEDEHSKDKGGELPMMTREMMAAQWGPAFADVAFSLELGKLSPVIQSEKGFHVLKSIKITPAEDRTLEEVQKSIAQQLTINEAANQKALAEAERLLAALKQGKKLSDLVPQAPADSDAGMGDPARIDTTVVMQRTGFFTRGSLSIPKLGRFESVSREAFKLSKDRRIPDSIVDLTNEGGRRSAIGEQKTYLVFTLSDRTDPDLNAFAQAKGALRDQLLYMRRQEQLRAWLQTQRSQSKWEPNQALLTEANMQQKRRGIQQQPIEDDY